MASRAQAPAKSASESAAKGGRREGGSKRPSKHSSKEATSSRGLQAASKDEQRCHKALSKICAKAASNQVSLPEISIEPSTSSAGSLLGLTTRAPDANVLPMDYILPNSDADLWGPPSEHQIIAAPPPPPTMTRPVPEATFTPMAASLRPISEPAQLPPESMKSIIA